MTWSRKKLRRKLRRANASRRRWPRTSAALRLQLQQLVIDDPLKVICPGDHGFKRCEFDDGDCDFCKKRDPVIWFMSTNYWDSREGDYYCTECACRKVTAEALDNTDYERELGALNHA